MKPRSAAPTSVRGSAGRFRRGGPRARGLATVGADPESATADVGGLRPALLKSARNTGQLNLSGRELTTVPEKVWRINQIDNDEAKQLTMSMDGGSEERWWDQKPLQKLLLSSNQLQELHEDIQLLANLQTLELQDNRLVSLPASISSLTCLTRLVLSHNCLSQLPAELFQLPALRLLLLNHNQLQQLPEHAGQLLDLEQLDLSHNQLECVPSSLGFLHRLNRLDLSHNQITSLPDDIGAMTSLRHLDVSHNRLQAVPDSLGQLYQLQVIDLRQNQLTAFPLLSQCSALKELHAAFNRFTEMTDEHVEGLKALTILDVSNNQLKGLPASFTELQRLERLDLRNNDITGTPLFLGSLPLLKSLQLEGNPLRGLRKDLLTRGTHQLLKYFRERAGGQAGVSSDPAVVTDTTRPDSQQSGPGTSAVLELTSAEDRLHRIHQMRSGRLMACSGHKLQEVPADLFSMAAEAQVPTVDISKNLLTAFPVGLNQLTAHLAELNISHNRLTSVPDSLAVCRSLTYLNLSSNRLSELPDGLASLKYVREVCLSVNRLTVIPSVLYELASLEILLMSDNAVTELDVGQLARLTCLATLDLRNNSIGHVPPKLGYMTQLRSLCLEGNTFKQPRNTVLCQGTVSLLEYLRDRVPPSERPIE